VIRLEEWVDIVALHRQGHGIRTIARHLGISRNAVRRALRRNGPPVYERKRRPSKLDPFKDYLIQRLTDFPELSSERLFEEIKVQGYTGGKTILKDFTLPYRRRRREPILRFETAPGEQAQVDWSDLGVHLIDGCPKKLYLFAMILGYSRCLFAEVVTKTDCDTLISCHRRAFAYFGGTTRTILYDNMKTVVLKRGGDGNHLFNPSFLDFAGYIGFSPKLCRPYRAKTKGKVERAFGYIKDRFLVGQTFTDLDDLNTRLRIWLETEANTRKHATTGEVPFARLSKENLMSVSDRSAKPTIDSSTLPQRRPLFVFASPSVEKRSLLVYEEVANEPS